MKKLWQDPKYRVKQTKKLEYIIICPNCGKEKTYKGYPYRDNDKRKFCSNSCATSYNSRLAWKNSEAKKKWSTAIKKAHNTEEYKQKAKAIWTDEMKISQAERSRTMIQEFWNDPLWAENQRRLFQQTKQTPEYIEAWKRGLHFRPTKPELELFLLLNQIDYPYIYIGDGSFWIGTKNPDFIWPEQRKLIEMYGSHWHNELEIEPRTQYFANYGFDTLFIWDYELEDSEQLLAKLEAFHKLNLSSFKMKN